MINDEIRKQIQREDIDWIRAYSNEIERHSEAALDGDQSSIAWVKTSLRKWAQGETYDLPPADLLRVAALHFLGSDAIVPLRRAQEFDLPKELDAANIAYQAVCNGHGDKSAPFSERIKEFVKDNWPAGTFTDEAIKRIGIVANQDTKTGPKRKKPV